MLYFSLLQKENNALTFRLDARPTLGHSMRVTTTTEQIVQARQRQNGMDSKYDISPAGVPSVLFWFSVEKEEEEELKHIGRQTERQTDAFWACDSDVVRFIEYIGTKKKSKRGSRPAYVYMSKLD